MRKFKLITLFIFALSMWACNYDFTEDIDLNPVTQGKVAKVFVGGNVECSQLSQVVNADFENMAFTTGRNDYSGGVFSSAWPKGLEVEVMRDGSVSWALTPEFNLLGDGSCYKVGAAIVKGSSASNIYYYGSGGATGDMGLFPPINASGTPSALSNLTFCFVKCTEVPVYIAIKSTFYPGPLEPDHYNSWFASASANAADYPFRPSSDWCYDLAVLSFTKSTSFALFSPYSGLTAGTASVSKGTGGYNVTINLVDGAKLNTSYVYISTTKLSGTSCPDYLGWFTYNHIGTPQSDTFTVPF